MTLPGVGILRTLSAPWFDVSASAPLAPTPSAPPLVSSPWADPDQLTQLVLAELFGAGNLDALPVTRAQAVAIPAVSRGRDLICVSVARLGLYAMNATGRLPVQPRLVAQPELGRSRFLTMLWTVDSLLFQGWAIWQITSRYAEDSRPRTVRLVPPSQVEFDTLGNVYECFGRQVRPDDVIRFDGPHEGFLARGAQTIRDARSLALAYAHAARTPIPNVELHQTAGEPLSDPEISSLIQSWAAARRGENGGVAYTNASVEAKMHGQPAESLLTTGRSHVRLDAAHHLGLPAWAVDAPVEGSSLTYSNVPSRSRELIDYALSGYMEAIASRLSLDDLLPAGTWASFSTDVLTDGDFGDRMTAYKAAVDAGIYTAAELRAREAGIPMEGTTPG